MALAGVRRKRHEEVAAIPTSPRSLHGRPKASCIDCGVRGVPFIAAFVDDAPRHAAEVVERGVVPGAERLRRLGRKRLHKPVVAVREVDDQVWRSTPAITTSARQSRPGRRPADGSGARPAQPLRAHVFDNRGRPVLRALAGHRGPMTPGASSFGRRAGCPRRSRAAGGSATCASRGPRPRRRARAQPLHIHADRCIELHSIHPSCVPQNTLGMLGGPRTRSSFPPPSGRVTPPRCGLFLLRRSQCPNRRRHRDT